MRLAALLTFLTAAGPASALSIIVEEPPPAIPLGEPLDAAITVTGPCALVNGTLEVLVGLSQGPAWLTGSRDRAGGVHPDRLQVTEEDCTDGAWTKDAVLHFSVDDDAPAFEPAPVVVWARVGNDMVNATTNVTAGFFARLDVQGPPRVLEVEPGRSVTAPFTLRNTGNGPLLVTFTPLVIPEAWNVAGPAPVRLTALRDGGAAVVVNVVVQPVVRPLVANFGDVVVLRMDAAHAEGQYPGATNATVELPVHVRGQNVPGPWPVLVLLAAVVSAVLRRR